ncbi:hypothetical protein P7C73_g1118, partial [Tremellales sp. Uapishka_1]
MRALPPVEGKEAWSFVLGAFLIEMTMLGGASSFSIFQDFLMRDASSPLRNQSSVSISAIGTLLLAMIFIAPILIRPLYLRFPHWIRRGTFLAIILAAGGLLVASFVVKPTALVIFVGLCNGTGAGIATTSYIMWLPQWFTVRRGFASGIAFAGAGSGGLVYPYVFTAALKHVGFAWTLRIWALVIVLGSGMGAVLVKPRLPVKNRATHLEREHARPTTFWKDYAYVFSPLFALNALLTFLASAGLYAVSFYLAPYCSSLGLSSATTSGAVSAFNASGLLGEIFIGYACDRIPYPYVAGAIGLVGCLATFLLLGFARSLPTIVIYSLLFGFAAGSWCATWSASCIDIGRLRKVDVDGVMISFGVVRGVAALVGPLIAGSLYQAQYSSREQLFGSFGFERLVEFVGSCMLGVAVFASITAFTRKRLFRGVDVRSVLDTSITIT